MDEVLDSHGEWVGKRVSDWDSSAPNEDTGREIVHQFTVADPTGNERLVSLESALKLLGYLKTDGSFVKVKSLAGTLKNRALNVMRLEMIREDMKEWEKWNTEQGRIRDRLYANAPNKFVQAPSTATNHVGYVTFSDGDFSKDLPEGFIKYNRPDVVLDELKCAWVNFMMKKQVGYNPEPVMRFPTYSMWQKEKDLVRQIARADKIIAQFNIVDNPQ
jgi:hypothetical protein